MPVVNLFKYKVWLDILTGCPPLEYVEVAIQAFRFVHSAGHFTFHEYIWGDFQQKIENIEPILST